MSDRIFNTLDATWPAARLETLGPFVLREGQGGGKRVSAATATRSASGGDIPHAEKAMRAMGQDCLFQIRGTQDAVLDQLLSARGYGVIDPSNVYACPVDQLTDLDIPPVTIFTLWEPLEIQRDIWESGGTDAARRAIMLRAKGVKTALLSRWHDHPGGAAFAAIHEGCAMVHALEVLPHQRGQGLGKWMMRGAAQWAAQHGADELTVICTAANEGANALYASLGMALVEQYHYRILPTGT